MAAIRAHCDSIFVVPSTDPTPYLSAAVTKADLARGRCVYVRGDDMAAFPGRAWCESAGIPIFLLPRSVFNYDAPLSSVLVHAAFVVVESVAAIFVARSFFDNVIGLERIVAARTGQLDAKNREMTLVFDHVQQGFLTARPDGALSAQHSRVVEQWLAMPVADEPVWAFFARVDPTFAQWLELGWSALVDGVSLAPRDRLGRRGRLRTRVVDKAGLSRVPRHDGPRGDNDDGGVAARRQGQLRLGSSLVRLAELQHSGRSPRRCARRPGLRR
jgi:hypothetical protein